MLTSVYKSSHWKPLSLQCHESFQEQLEKIHSAYQSSREPGRRWPYIIMPQPIRMHSQGLARVLALISTFNKTL